MQYINVLRNNMGLKMNNWYFMVSLLAVAQQLILHLEYQTWEALYYTVQFYLG